MEEIKNFGIMIPKKAYKPIKSLTINLFSCAYTDSWIWFRIFGYGLIFINTKIRPEKTFSERQGLRTYLYIGKFKIRILKP